MSRTSLPRFPSRSSGRVLADLQDFFCCPKRLQFYGGRRSAPDPVHCLSRRDLVGPEFRPDATGRPRIREEDGSESDGACSDRHEVHDVFTRGDATHADDGQFDRLRARVDARERDGLERRTRVPADTASELRTARRPVDGETANRVDEREAVRTSVGDRASGLRDVPRRG